MASKTRVSALAKEVGTTSKAALGYLAQCGEFVKSASSVVEGPVADRVRKHFTGDDPAPALLPASAARLNERRRTDYVQLNMRQMVSAIQGALAGNEWPPQPYSAKDWSDLLGSISALSFGLADAVRRLRLIEETSGGVGVERSFPLQEEIAEELLHLARRTRIETR